MIGAACLRLPRAHRTVMIAAGVTCAWFMLLGMGTAFGAEPAKPKADDLDVTMQIIVDPNAKLPDDVVRKIPLPERKTDAPAGQTKKDESDKSSAAPRETGRERVDQPRGQDVAERAREQARDAQEQREQSRRAAEERERERGPPKDPPRGPPGR